MTEQKKPEPGQWLVMNDRPNTKVFLVGKNAKGQWVIEWEDGDTSVDATLDDWHHEPSCDSWTWQPKDWVTQDRVPARPGIDQIRWSSWDPDQDWITARQYFLETKFKHGDTDPNDGLTLSVRCLRKDLPPLPEVWPKYYETTVPGELAFLRRDTATVATYVLTDGKEDGAIVWGCADEWRKELTESEALSRIVKPVDAEAPSRDVIEQMAEHEDCVSVGGMAADAGLPVASRLDLMAMIKEANEMLRSAYAVAEREGGCTNWEAFRNRLKAVLEQQHRVMYPKSVSGTSKTCVMCNGSADLTDDSCKQCHEFAIEQVCGVRPELRIYMTVDGILYCDTKPRTPLHKQVQFSSCGCFVVEVGE